MKKEYYTTSLQHILAELERVDLLIQVQIRRARQVHMADSEFQGLCISEQDIDALLAQPLGMPRWATTPGPLSMPEVRSVLDQLAGEIAQRKAESLRQDVTLRLEELAHIFRLIPFDIDVLLICLASELDLRYERLYAYLQDDVTKKRPSVGLVLNLLCPSFQDKLAARERFSSESPLLKHHLLHLFDDPSYQNPLLLSKYLRVDERVVNYLFDSDEIDIRLQTCAMLNVPQIGLDDLFLPADVKHRLALLIQGKAAKDEGLILYFQGTYGVGKQSTAEALCHELGIGLLNIDGERLLNTEGLSFDKAVRLAEREALLQGAALYWNGFDALLADDKRAFLDMLLRQLEGRSGLTFLAGDTTWEPMNALHNTPCIRIEFSRPHYSERVQLWSRSLNGNAALATDVDLSGVANKFRFSAGLKKKASYIHSASKRDEGSYL